MNNQTITFIKPDAFERYEEIIGMIETHGFVKKTSKIITMNKQESKEFCDYFYQQHVDKPFFGEIVDYIASGPIIAILLEKDNAIEDFRKLIKAKSIVYEDHGKGETYTIDMGKVIAKLDVGGTPYDGGYMNISISKHQGE